VSAINEARARLDEARARSNAALAAMEEAEAAVVAATRHYADCEHEVTSAKHGLLLAEAAEYAESLPGGVKDMMVTPLNVLPEASFKILVRRRLALEQVATPGRPRDLTSMGALVREYLHGLGGGE
jgi:hypothetical protein